MASTAMSGPSGPTAAWLLEQEARALLTRLDRVKPFVLQETMVPAAGPATSAQLGIERYLATGRERLKRDVDAYIAWIRGAGRLNTPEEQQRRLTILRLAFNTSLAQLDTFADALTQRSESETGVWLAGLDVAAEDALRLAKPYYRIPPILCHLDRGIGGAIRRARTRLPGGGENPVAIIRIPRERMIGFGIASSLAHEVGHQAAALLGLVPSLRAALQQVQQQVGADERPAWAYWERTISEAIADFWAVAKVGVSSTLGLIAVVSLPRAFVLRVNLDDPHPFPWIRVRLSCALGEALYPHPQWRQLASVWDSLYPLASVDAGRRRTIDLLLATMPQFVRLVAQHRPAALRGQSLAAVVAHPGRSPDRLAVVYEQWRANPALMFKARPTEVFAVFGRARIRGLLSPEEEDRLLAHVITLWALRHALRTDGTAELMPAPTDLASNVAQPSRGLVSVA